MAKVRVSLRDKVRIRVLAAGRSLLADVGACGGELAHPRDVGLHPLDLSAARAVAVGRLRCPHRLRALGALAVHLVRVRVRVRFGLGLGLESLS